MQPSLDVAPIALRQAPTGALTIEIIADRFALDAIATEWRHLERHSSGAVFFQSFDWCQYIWQTAVVGSGSASSSAANFQPRVIVARAGARVLAIWPLAIKSSAAGRFAVDLSEPFAQYSDLLLAPDADVDAVMTAALAEIARWRVDGLILRKVRGDAGFAPWLARHASRLGTTEQAPAIELSAFANFDAYRNSLNSKTKKNLRNYRNRLARSGQSSHAVIETPGERAAVIERCFLGRADWLESSGLSSTAFADPLFKSVVSGLARGDRGAPPVMAMRLGLIQPKGADVDLSAHWGFLHQGRYYAFMAAKNPEFDEFSPGRLHLEAVIAACAERGVETVDLMLPSMPYKLTWATTSVAVETFGLALTARGRMFIQGWHGFLRPAAKSTWLALPPTLRRVALRIVETVTGRYNAITRPPMVTSKSKTA